MLFITWDGPQTNYLRGLFLPIFKELSAFGYDFCVLQFIWGSPEAIDQNREACSAFGVPYRAVPVWRSSRRLGPFISAVLGGQKIRKAVHDWGIQILMPRSLMPALAILSMGGRSDLRLVFDADGFAADEFSREF